MQKEHLNMEKREMMPFEQYVNLRKKSYEDSKQRDKRGGSGISLSMTTIKEFSIVCTH